MSGESGTNRWWENYLVRYLMPSIAGVVIIAWLCEQGGSGLRALLFLPPHGLTMDTASLTLIFLYGNLFCYIASYPILVFHVTRVTDFKDERWPATYFSDGYIWTIAVVFLSFIVFHLGSAIMHFYAAFALVGALVVVQINRLISATSRRVKVRGLKNPVSPAFGLAFSLSKRRGLLSVTENTRKAQKKTAWRQDFIASYRHLREHGNSAFIFTLELALAVLVYLVIMKPGQTPVQQLGSTGALLALWASPALFVHFLGQHLERRFSQYDWRLKHPEPPTPTRKETSGKPVSVEVTIVKWRT